MRNAPFTNEPPDSRWQPEAWNKFVSEAVRDFRERSDLVSLAIDDISNIRKGYWPYWTNRYPRAVDLTIKEVRHHLPVLADDIIREFKAAHPETYSKKLLTE